MIATVISSATVLILATIMTFSTTEATKNRGQLELLSDISLSFDVLNQVLSQIVTVYECNCNANCLMCNNPGGCPEFPLPATWSTAGVVPNPTNPLPNGGNCSNDPAGLVEAQLNLPPTTLQGRCVLHAEVEDLANYPKVPVGFAAGAPPAVVPAAPWLSPPAPDSPFAAATPLFSGGVVAAGDCNDNQQRNAGTTEGYYSAGCSKDLYVYYVLPAANGTAPGYVLFVLTTTPARSGAAAQSFRIYGIGDFPGRSGWGLGAGGITGLACGYLPAYQADPAGLFNSANSTTSGQYQPAQPLLGGYANNAGALPRSLEFGMFLLAKVSNTSTESWVPTLPTPAGRTNFFFGAFRQLISRTVLHNLSERGIHFLHMFSPHMALTATSGPAGTGAGHGRPTGCFLNTFSPPGGSRSMCCSGAVNAAGVCVACVPSGVAIAGATGNSACCSEQMPVVGVCP